MQHINGHIVAIFRVFYNKTPKDFNEVIAHEPQIITLFVIQPAVREGLFSLVAHVPMADHLAEFPIFRGTNNLKADNIIWYFWDGEKQWRVDRPLTEEEKIST